MFKFHVKVESIREQKERKKLLQLNSSHETCRLNVSLKYVSPQEAIKYYFKLYFIILSDNAILSFQSSLFFITLYLLQRFSTIFCRTSCWQRFAFGIHCQTGRKCIESTQAAPEFNFFATSRAFQNLRVCDQFLYISFSMNHAI